MDKERAIAFLKRNQPMPDDKDLSKEVIGEYDAIREYFLSNPDEECIPLFLNSFGERDGYGVYQLIEDVMMNFDKKKVIVHLIEALQSQYKSIRYWNAQIAVSFVDEKLIIPLENLMYDQDNDIKISAIIALSQIRNNKIVTILNRRLHKETDEETLEFIKQVICDLESC